MITAIVRAGSAISKGSKLIPRSAAASKPVLASKSVKLAPSYPKVDAPKGGNGLVKRLPDALDFGSSFASAFSDTFGTDTPKQNIKTKNCCDTLVPLVDSISKKLIDIDKLLKDELKFDRKDSDYQRKKKEKGQYKKQEEKLETPKKIKPKAKLSPGAPGISLGERIKRFVMFTLLGWLVDKILPLLPKLVPVFNAVGKVINFGTELFGGLVSGLSKFLEFGIKLTNGLTKSLGFISGARTEQEFSDFEKKFNRMVDLSILAAMLIGDSGNDLFDMFRKGKGGKGGKPSTSRPKPGTGGRPKVTTSGGKSTSRFGRIKERFTDPFRQKSKVTTSGGRQTGLGGRVKDLQDKITRPTTKVTTSGGKTTGILGKIADLGDKFKKTISPTKITGASTKPGLLKGATEGTQKLLASANKSKLVSGTKNVFSKVKLPPAVGRAAGPVGTVLFAGIEYGARKSSGQTKTQAAVGTGASVAGGLAGAAGGAKAGALIGAAIGAPFAGVGAAPGAAAGAIIGGILGGLGGSWAASSVADTATGANKAQPKPVAKHNEGGIVKNTLDLKGSLPSWFESANKNKVSTKSTIKINLPKKKKSQSEKPGKDIGGYGEITKLFPDPEGKVSGTGSSQGGAAITSAAQKKVGFNIFNPFSWFSKSTSGPAAPAQPSQGSSQPNALFALTKASQSLKKIPFVGHLMGAAVDIAMGQKPDRDLYQTMADSVLYLGQKAAEGKSKDIQSNIQKLATGGIASIAESSSSISLDAGKVANKTLRDSLAGAIEIGANGALKNVKDEIISADVRGRNPSARSGFDPRYDESPSRSDDIINVPTDSPDGATPDGGGGGGLGGLTPNAKALLNTIRWAEGTSGPKGYNTWFGGRTDMDLSKLTINQVVAEQKKRLKSGQATYGRYTSAAVGAYQMMTPEVFASRAGLDPSKALFTPENQDKMAIAGYMKGQAKMSDAEINAPISKQQIAKISGVWASLPNMSGVSAYGQPVKKYSDLEAKYKGYLGQAQQQQTAQRSESYKGADPRSKDGKPIKVGGKGVVDIGKSLISKGFTVAEHPDFTKTPPKGSYTPGKGSVSNVHSGRGHYEGRALDVTDWRGSLEDSKARYRSVLDSLQNNPSINMLIHDSWGFKDRTGKSGPGSHGHPTHMHIETKFHGGLVDKEGLVKIHKKEFVVDADTVNLFGADFFKTLNSVENKVTLAKVAPDLISRISESIKGTAFVLPQTDQYTKEEDPRSLSQSKDSSQKTTKNLDTFNKQQETKTEESQQKEDENEDGKKQRVQVIPASHPQSGSGFTIKGVTDGNGRPLILSKGGIKGFGEMMQDSKGAVRGSDVASGKRSPAHNKKVGGVPNSNHLGGNALDIHGTSEPWMRRHGRKYGWIVNDYPGSHGGHFDYKGDDKDSGGDTLAAMSSDSTMDSVTDYGGAPSGGGGGGGGAPSGGGGGGNYEPVDVEAEPSEPLIPGGKSRPTGSPGGGFSGQELDGMTNKQKWKAVMLMAEKAGAKYPELVAAQFALESGWGKSLSAKNNYFGIKATGNEDATVSNTREEVGGGSVYIDARFKNFKSPQDAINHLVTQWYKDYKSYKGVNNAKSAVEAAAMLKSQGYATDSGYMKHLQRLLGENEDVRMTEEDKVAFNKKSKDEFVGDDKDRPVEAGGDPGDVEKDQQIAGSTKDKRYGRLGIPNTDGQDTGADLELFGKRGEIGKTFGDNDKQGPYGNRGVEISFPYELIYLDKIPGGRNAGRKSMDVDGTQRRVYKGAEGSAGFGNVGSYFYKDPRTGKMFEVMMGHGNKPKIPAGTVVGWQGASGSSDSMQGGVYDHVSFHVNAVDGGDPGPIFNKFVNSLLSGEGAKVTAQRREEKKAQAEIAKREAAEKKKNPLAKAGNAGQDLISGIKSTVSSLFGGDKKAAAKPKPGSKPKPGTKPKKENWLQSAVGLMTGKKKLSIVKAEGGGNIDPSGIISRPKTANIEQFASYEDPSGPSLHIIIVPSPAKQLPPEKTRGLSGYPSKPSKSSNKYYSPSRRK
jgi:flagellum-specific peptidoglycan hydrolase FlgJ/muramidase (phage lysozyme)